MSKPREQQSGWYRKFAVAVRGIAVGTRGQSSFAVHLAVALAVVIAAWLWDVSRWEWCVLVLCIVAVLAAELFNSAIEHLAQAITADHNDHLRDALDISSGAVLVASLGAVAVGVAILGMHVFFS
jgi:diacylglycerol kinase